MGIKVTSNFDEQASLPLDSRTVQLNITNRNNIPSSIRYEGMVVYVIDDKKTYQLVNGITNTDWVEFGSSDIIDDGNSSLTTTYSSDKIDTLISGSLNYLGSWDASSNTPYISDGTGTANDYYKVSVAGTQNLGSTNIVFNVGDDVIHNGTVWEKFGSSGISVIDNLTSTSSGDALSANMGRELQDNKQDKLPSGVSGDILTLDVDGVTPKWAKTTNEVINWLPNIIYSINDIVNFGGVLYKGKQTSINKRPDISPLEWKEATVNEAPVDGKSYWRKDEDWVDTTDYGGF